MQAQMTQRDLKVAAITRHKKSSARRAKKGWPAVLVETLIGEYLISPLLSVDELKSEAFWMNSDCEQHLARCKDGVYALFSIRTRSGERLAILGLSFLEHGWVFDYCSGLSNSEVLEETLEYLDEDGCVHVEHWPTELYYIVHEVVRLVNARKIARSSRQPLH